MTGKINVLPRQIRIKTEVTSCYFQTLDSEEGATCARLGSGSFAPRGRYHTGSKIYTSGLFASPSPRRTSAPWACLSGPLYADELPRKICQTKLILDTSPGKDSACVCVIYLTFRETGSRNNAETMPQIKMLLMKLHEWKGQPACFLSVRPYRVLLLLWL